MTIETLALLRNVIATLHLDVAAPDFVQTAQAVGKALAELDEELAELDLPSPACAPSPTGLGR